MSRCKTLHDLIQARAALAMPGVYDAFSARLVEQAGFQACQISGAAVAATMLGLPDMGILSLRDQINAVQMVTNAVSIPVMADGDTGYGNALNAFHTVRLLEAAGAAGVNIEDQTFPKRCGHMDGKAIISTDEMVQKIRAAAEARRDPHFVINARTDVIAIDGVPAAIERGNAYLAAGATIIFVEAPRSRDQIEALVQGIKGPVSINMLGTTGGKTPSINLADLRELGVARVSYPGVTIASAGAAMQRALRCLVDHGDLIPVESQLMPLAEVFETVGLSAEKAREQAFAS